MVSSRDPLRGVSGGRVSAATTRAPDHPARESDPSVPNLPPTKFVAKVGIPNKNDKIETAAKRSSGINDPLAARARDLQIRAVAAEKTAARLRAERDQTILELRRRDPQLWSYGKLSKTIGCSRELIALIVRKNSASNRNIG